MLAKQLCMILIAAGFVGTWLAVVEFVSIVFTPKSDGVRRPLGCSLLLFAFGSGCAAPARDFEAVSSRPYVLVGSVWMEGPAGSLDALV